MPDRIWAPWRLEYIEKDEPEGGCIFVDLPAQSDDRKNLILHRGEHAFVILNAYPYTNGHLMVAPHRHTGNLEDLSDAELLEVNQFVRDCVRWLTSAYGPQGFNIGVNMGRSAGAGIEDHLHWHIVPRWNGDTNFMTTVGETRVLAQSLEDTYDRLRGVIESE
ncbi:MAG: HIT domain-containing protein [Armatimonadota bacterium]|nr:HIT domain-containing protein [Armatimonadota bacterium]